MNTLKEDIHSHCNSTHAAGVEIRNPAPTLCTRYPCRDGHTRNIARWQRRSSLARVVNCLRLFRTWTCHSLLSQTQHVSFAKLLAQQNKAAQKSSSES